MQRKYFNLGDILAGRWLMDRSYAQAYFPVVHGMLTGIKVEREGEPSTPFTAAVIGSNQVYYISEYGEANPVSKAPDGSIAIMDIKGPITKADQYCGSAGTETKAAILKEAIANPNIKGLILSIDSGGGEASATEFFADIIKNSSKPIVAHINGMAASAAYWIASAANKIVVSGKTSSVGSIGVYIQLADFAAYYEERGIKVHTIYAPQSTEKNKEYNEALKGNYEPMEQDLKTFADFFINAVKDNRGSKINYKAKTIFEGAMFYSEDAVENGLADEIGDIEKAIDVLNSLISTTSQNAGNASFNAHNLSDMKLNINSNQVRLAALLGVAFAENQETVEVELTADHLATIESALQTAITGQEEAAASLETVTGQLNTANADLEARTSELATANQTIETLNGRGATNVIAAQDANANVAKKGIDAYVPEGGEALYADAKAMFNQPS